MTAIAESVEQLPAQLWAASWITHPAWAEYQRGAPDGPGQGASPAALPVLSMLVPISGTVRRARWWLTGLGTILATVGGSPIDEALLEPGYADFTRRVAARCVDVTHLLSPGGGGGGGGAGVELAVELGTGVAWLEDAPGRYAKFGARTAVPQLLARLEIEYADGGRDVVVTDAGWSARLGPTTTAHWHGGEDYDARRATTPEPTVPAEVQRDATAGPEPWWRRGEPVVVVQDFPVADSRVVRLPAVTGGADTDAVLLDVGLNVAGRYTLRLAETVPGQRIVVRPAELLTPAGTVDQFSTGTPIWDSVICDGSALAWHPRHVYHGFRYLQVEGLTPAQQSSLASGVTIQVMRAGARPLGAFGCSDPVLEKLHRMTDRAVQSNMYSVFTDCPHREKLGWLEEIDLCFDTLIRGYDVVGLLRDTLVHIRDAQDDSGLVPSITPEFVRFTDPVTGESNGFRDDPNWGSTIVHLPWQLYRQTGDDTELRLSWPAVQRYLAYLGTRAGADGLLDHGLGDWVAVDESTPRSLVASAGYLRTVRTASRIAGVIGARTGATALAELAERLRSAIAARFHDAASGVWGSASQASWALAIDTGAVSPADRPAADRGLLAAIAAAGTTVTVGEIALPPMLRALAAMGRHDVIAALVRTTDGPGYGLQIASEATALNESFEAPVPGGPSSQNHFMLGMIDSWLTGEVAGFQQSPESIGWRRALVRPVRVPGVEWASTSYESPRGRFSVRWDAVGLDVCVPDGGTARIVLPADTGWPLPGRDVGPGEWRFAWDVTSPR